MANAGTVIGNAGAGMMGLQLPEEQRQAEMQGIMKSVDTSTVEGLRTAAQQFAQMGDTARAQALTDRANQLETVENARNDRTAKQAEIKASATRKESLVAMLVKKDPNLSVELAGVLADDTTALMSFLNPKVNAKVVSVGGRQVLINGDSGEPIKDLGAVSKTDPTTIILPGSEKAVDIPKFRSDLQATVKPYTLTIDAADTVISAIDLGINEGNFVAAKGAAVALVKAFGDGTVSRIEAEKNGADPSIIGGGIDAINRMFTGTASIDTMKKLRKTAEVLKTLNQAKRNKELNVQKGMAKSSKIPADAIDLIFSGFGESETKRKVVNTGTITDAAGVVRKVVKYDNGDVEYAN
jgi:hypothetical protein